MIVQSMVQASVLILLLIACSHSYHANRLNAEVPSPKLDRNGSAYISTPNDGKYGAILYNSSGNTTAQETANAFSPFLATITIGGSASSIEEALRTARHGSFTYLIYPTILHWEDRATAWSGLRDRLTLKLEIVEIATGRILDSMIIEGQSRWFTFGGDHPEDLLPEPIQAYASSLF